MRTSYVLYNQRLHSDAMNRYARRSRSLSLTALYSSFHFSFVSSAYRREIRVVTCVSLSVSLVFDL